MNGASHSNRFGISTPRATTPLLIGTAAALLCGHTANAQPPQRPRPVAPKLEDALSAGEIFKRASRSIVTISTKDGFGSGVLVDPSGVLVSSLHVVQGASAATVRLANGDSYDSVSVVDSDARKDLVVLKIKGFNLPVVALGDSDAVAIGDTVYAIGAPKGLDLTLTEGIVSAIRDSGDGYRLIQTSAAISPGSSGGGLFDRRGRLIGITTAKMKGGENLNFATPINYARGLISPNATITLADLNRRTGVDTNRAPVSDDIAPTLLKMYTSPQGSIAVFEQRGDAVHVTFSDRAGNVIGHADLKWQIAGHAFVGAGRIEIDPPCPAGGATDAPINEEIHVIGDGLIRDRWLNPDSVDCSTGAVHASSWMEKIWGARR